LPANLLLPTAIAVTAEFIWAHPDTILAFGGCKLCDRGVCHCCEAYQIYLPIVARLREVGKAASSLQPGL